METLALTYLNQRTEINFFRLHQSIEPYLRAFIRKNFNKQLDEYEIDEVIINTMLKIYINMDSFKPKRAKFTTWICTIAKNESLLLLRSRAKTKTPYEVNWSVLEDPSEDLYEKKLEFESELELVESLIEELPEHYKSLIKDIYYDRIPQKILAAKYDLNKNTLKTHARKARRLIQEKLYNEDRDKYKRLKPQARKNRL